MKKMENNIAVTSKNVKLIYSNRICCYDDEQIDFKIGLTKKKEDELRIRFLFKYSNDSNHRIGISVDDGSVIVVELTNFSNPLGTGLKKPISIAKLDGRSIYMMFSVYKIKDANPLLDISLYLENNDEG